MQFRCSKSKNNNSLCLSAKQSYYIADHLITKQESINDLGIIIDDRLSFKEHYNTITSKAYKALYSILKCFDFSSLSIKTMLYKTFVRPQLEYCSIVWAPIKLNSIVKLKKVQRTATKMILKQPYTDYKSCFSKCNLPTLHTRCRYLDSCHVYKLLYNTKVKNYPKLLNISRCKSKKNPYNLKQIFVKNNWYKREFSRHCIEDWNLIPNVIKEQRNYITFKEHLLTNIHSIYSNNS